MSGFVVPKVSDNPNDITHSYSLSFDLRDYNTGNERYRTVKDGISVVEKACKRKRVGHVSILYTSKDGKDDKLTVHVKDYKQIIDVLTTHCKDLTPNLWSYTSAWKYCDVCEKGTPCDRGNCYQCHKMLDDPSLLSYTMNGEYWNPIRLCISVPNK